MSSGWTSGSLQVLSGAASSAPGTLMAASSSRMPPSTSWSLGTLAIVGFLLVCSLFKRSSAEPAVDGERGSVHVRRVLGCEECDGGGDLFGSAHPARRDGRLEVVRDVGGHVGLDDARR